MLGIVDIAEDVIRGMVAKSSVCDGVDDHAHLVPQVFLCRHRSQNNDDEQRIEEKRGGEGGSRFDQRGRAQLM
jgi:hypothetical protein